MTDPEFQMQRYMAARREASRRLGENINRCFFELIGLYRGNGQHPSQAAQSAVDQMNTMFRR